MLVFYLFRLKLFRPGQAFSHSTGAPEQSLVDDIIRELPSVDIGEGLPWTIGNVSQVGEHALLFVIGDAKYRDQISGNFMDIENASSSCTHVLYDGKYGILSIAMKQALSPNPECIAHQLQQLLNSRIRLHDGDIRLEIEGIIDPEPFIDHIMDNHAITEFSIRSGEPNIYDNTQDLHASMQCVMEMAGGKSVQTSIHGDDLDRETLERLTRVAAGSGYEVTIHAIEDTGQKPVVHKMSGEIIDFLVKNEDILAQAESIRDMAQQIYLHIRGE